MNIHDHEKDESDFKDVDDVDDVDDGDQDINGHGPLQVDQQDHNAKTPLLYAIGAGVTSTTKLLLTLRASTNHRDSGGLSALDVAVRYSRSQEIVDLLQFD